MKLRVLILALLILVMSVGSVFATDSQNILQNVEGTYSIDYHVRGSYLDVLKKCYGDKIIIKDGCLNGWLLNVENIAKSANDEYIVTCTYLLKGFGTPPPMVEAKLFIKLSDSGFAQKIDYQEFSSTGCPNGEWKTTMTFYKLN